MQSQPQTLALPQGPPPPVGRGNFMYGRGGMSFGASQPLLRVGRLMPANELIHQRMASDLITCPELLQRQAPEGPPPSHNKPYDTQWGSKGGGRGPPMSITADVGYTGSGGGAGRSPLSVNHPFTSVAASHQQPPSSVTQTQQASQSQQLRAQAPPLPPGHNHHNSGGPPPQSASHSQHIPHPHSALTQHHQHHPVLSSVSVSGATGAPGNPVQQSGVAVPPGQTSAAPPVTPHELNAQAMPQASSQQIQPSTVTGVPLAGSVPTGTHSMMYQTPNPNQQTPQSSAQVRGFINSQFYQHPQPNTTHLHANAQQHRQVMNHTPQSNLPGYNPFQFMPLVHSNQVFPQYASVAQARPTNAQHQYQQMHQATHPPYPLQYVQGFPHSQPLYEGNPKQGWKNHFPAGNLFYPHGTVHAKPNTSGSNAQRVKRIIAIIDPNTNKNILDEMNLSSSSSSITMTQSKDLSATSTPTPRESTSTSGETGAEFANKVIHNMYAEDDSNNIHSDTVDCSVNNSKPIDNSPSVLNSEHRENDRLNCVDKEINAETNQNARTVPEHSVTKSDQSINATSTSLPQQHVQSDVHCGSALSITSQEPQVQQSQPQLQHHSQPQQPQPQRPAKQPRGSHHTSSHSTQGSHGKNIAQQVATKQSSPPHQGKQNQKSGNNSNSLQTKGNQNTQSGHQSKGGNANAKQNQKMNTHSNSNAQHHAQKSHQIQQQQQQQQQQPTPPPQHQQQQPTPPTQHQQQQPTPPTQHQQQQPTPPPQHQQHQATPPPQHQQHQQQPSPQTQVQQPTQPSHKHQKQNQPQQLHNQSQVQQQQKQQTQQLKQQQTLPQTQCKTPPVQASQSPPRTSIQQHVQPTHISNIQDNHEQEKNAGPSEYTETYNSKYGNVVSHKNFTPDSEDKYKNYQRKMKTSGDSSNQQNQNNLQGPSQRVPEELIPPAGVVTKPSDKRSPPSVESIQPDVVAESHSEPTNKQRSNNKTASPSPVPAAPKKEVTSESNQSSSKRGKEKISEDNSHSKDNAKSKQEDNLTKLAEPPIQNQSSSKQLTHGKPPKVQPITEKAPEAAKQQPQQSPQPQHEQQSHQPPPAPQQQHLTSPSLPSQSPKSESPPAPQASLKSSSTNESRTQSSTDTEAKVSSEIPEVETQQGSQVNHAHELKSGSSNHEEQNHASEKSTKSSSQSKITNKEGQCGLDKQEGKRQYDRNFLLEMQKTPLSLKRPDSLPNLEVVLDNPVVRSFEGKAKMMTDFTPGYLQSSSRKMQKGGKNSQQGLKRVIPCPRVIDINLNASTESRLKSTENAWKPSLKKQEPLIDEDNAKHEDTIKRMRGILNKLTPDNFNKLVEQVQKFKIEKFETFDKVIGLIFEKAVDEQSFSSTYAQLCKVLSQMSIKTQGKGDETRFRNLIISKCQSEFEKDNNKHLNKEEREKEIESEKDADKKAELKANLEFEEMRLRKRSVGNIRFIGELYKHKMLTSSIMMRILMGLLEKKDDESLECLCKLLTTIGKMLESSAQNSSRAQEDLNDIFVSMEKIVNSRKTSSRVRFLMMDVIDLRLDKWVPRREDAKPKTKAEVHADIRKEEIEQQIILSNTPRKDDRERKRSKDNRIISDDSGWSTVSTNARRPFDSSRLKNNTFHRTLTPDVHEFRTGFSSWGKGSSGGMKDKDEDQKGSNRYSILEGNLDGTRRSNQLPPRLAPQGMNIHRQGGGSFGSKSMPPPSEKETTSSKNISMPTGDRSKSNSRSNSRQASKERIPTVPVLDDEKANRYTTSIVAEYVVNDDIKDATLCVEERFKGKSLVKFINFSMEWVIDKSTDKLKKIGDLYLHLLREKVITLPQFLEGSKGVIENMPESEIDVPKITEYMAEILCRLAGDGGLKFGDIFKILKPAGPKMCTTFGKVLKRASDIFGEKKVMEIWAASNLSLGDVLPPDSDLTEYTKRHGIEFLLNGPANNRSRPIVDDEAPFEFGYVRKELLKLFRSQATDEDVFKWIDNNVGRFTYTKKFVRALTTALTESLLITPKDDGTSVVTENFESKLKRKLTPILKYVDGNPILELPCIYGMQSVCVQYQHPPGFLEQAFNAFYDREVLSEDSFIEWERSNDPEEQVGKGVCVTSVRKFLTWIKSEENDALDSSQT